MKLKPIMWTLEQALPLIREVQPVTRKHKFHVTVGGGVVNKGKSRKDLDLFFLPLHGEQCDPEGLFNELQAMWGKGNPLGEGIYPESPHVKKVKFLVGPKHNMRIDAFIWKVDILGEDD